MKGSHYFANQHVLFDDLNNTEESKGLELRRRSLALITNDNAGSGSVVGEYGNTALLVTKDAAAQFTIAAGAAIDNQGEYIYLASDLTVNKSTYSGTNLEWSSVGSATFYIKLNYVASSGSYKQDDLGNSYPTRYEDDYAIQVSSAAPSGSQVLIASFTADPTGEISDDISDERIFIRTRAYDDATYLGNSPIVGHTRVSDHIHAKGSGTQSTTNPHGLTIYDLGYSDSSILSHWRDAHTNGIMLLARDATTLGSWSGSVISPISAAYITFAPPTAYAIMNVGGALFSGSLASLSASSAPSDGDFWVVADGTATPQFLSTGSYSFDDTNPHKYPAYVRIALVTIADGGDDITSYTDYRDFFAMSLYDIKADYVEASSNDALTRSSTLVNTLNRLRYQIQSSNPFTAIEDNLYQASLREMDITYQNTNTKPTFVSVVFIATSGISNPVLHISTGSVLPPPFPDTSTWFSVSSVDDATNSMGTLSGIVPPDYYYRVENPTSGSAACQIASWREVN